MKVEKIEDNRIYFSVESSKCSICNRPMVDTIKYDLPERFLRSNGIQQISTSIDGICFPCQLKGKYNKKCYICETEKAYPSEFSLEVRWYAKYAEEDSQYEHICKDCIKNRPSRVLETLMSSDDYEEIKL